MKDVKQCAASSSYMPHQAQKAVQDKGAQQRKTVCLLTLNLTEFYNQTLWIMFQ